MVNKMHQISKYPRTPHIEGSALQPGDDGSDRMSIQDLREKYRSSRFVTEEKLDGANCGISFSDNLDLILQSRGHILMGGAREAQFGPLKSWASHQEAVLLEILEDRFIMYGEWMFARHTMFYDQLPHYFFEFDIFDKKEAIFLSTQARHALLAGSPILSVPVLSQDWPKSGKALSDLVQKPLYRSDNWRDALTAEAERAGACPEQSLRQAGCSDLSEGLYIKIEEGGETVARYKLVRESFVQTILESGSHWHDRPLIRNQLRDGVDLHAGYAVPEVQHEF